MRRAFTLIELLVVVSIIALLIAILLPALGAARASAIRTQCLSQVRSLGQASAAYSVDHKDAYPQREAEGSILDLRFPHRVNHSGQYDLNESFFSQYMPITITTGTDREGDEVLFCPGAMYDTRNPSIGQYNYEYITYQYSRVRQGNPYWAYTEDGVKLQPNLTGADPIQASRYPIWSDLTVMSTPGIYIGHDVASTTETPGGMNSAYGDGSAFWKSWNESGVYLINNQSQQYFWGEVPD